MSLSSDAHPAKKNLLAYGIMYRRNTSDNFELRLYFEPNGPQKHPDFALYSSLHGIILFEIKDHTINQIEEFNHQECDLLYNDEPKNIRFTRKLAIQYIDEFKKVGESIPVSKFYVFPYLREQNLKDKFQFDTSNSSNPFLFADDFDDFDRLLRKTR